MKAHLVNTHRLVTRSRSSAKVNVKYQGHVSQKMGVLGALVFFFFLMENTHSTCFRHPSNLSRSLMCTYTLHFFVGNIPIHHFFNFKTPLKGKHNLEYSIENSLRIDSVYKYCVHTSYN